MASFFTWLDYSEQDKRKMLDVINLFNEKTTRDELGVGSIRDAFAELFFPGTSTIQTRARYFLFVPWIYQELVNRKVPSQQMRASLRQYEVDLITALATGGEKEGVIGIQAKASLKRLPSNIYWYGLGAWGIRLFPGSQEDYHQAFDGQYRRSRRPHRNDDGDVIESQTFDNWHRGLPPAPSGFLENASFSLTYAEAEYLNERIMTQHSESMLAFLIRSRQTLPTVSFIWEHPQVADMPVALQQQLRHAQNFSEAIHGAALLYNLMLAEQKQATERIEQYHQALQNWATHLSNRQIGFQQWNQDELWAILQTTGSFPSLPTQQFIRDWLKFALEPAIASNIAHDAGARRLIQNREAVLKGGQARLNNPRALELWQGESGTARLDYRWGTARRLLTDILDGLAQENAHVAA